MIGWKFLIEICAGTALFLMFYVVIMWVGVLVG